MIISMKRHASRAEIDEVTQRIEEFGYKIHTIEGEERVVIGAIGVGDTSACLEALEAMSQVEKAVRISAPYKFVSREFKPEKTVIRVGHDVEVGGEEFVVMAGPCTVESEKQILESAELAARGGAKVLRGGAFKPRTSPYDFQGMEEEGLKLLAQAREKPLSVGRTLPDYGAEVRGEDGELFLRGPGMLDAYLHPWRPRAEILEDGWFRTGDLARCARAE